MADDIVTRLRQRASTWADGCETDVDLDATAADEIERLRAENAALRDENTRFRKALHLKEQQFSY